METVVINRSLLLGKRRFWALLVLGLLLVLGACGSAVQVSEAPAPVPPVDKSPSFSGPVQPLDGEPLGVLADGRVEVRDANSGTILSTQPLETRGDDIRATSVDGAVYVTEHLAAHRQLISRIDAGGVETIEWATDGTPFDHLVDTSTPSVISRGEAGTELVRFHSDGQIEGYSFEAGVFVDLIGETVLLADTVELGNIWVLDEDLTFVEGFAVDTVREVPELVDADTVQIVQTQTRHLNVRTQAFVSNTSESQVQIQPLLKGFGDGWIAEAEAADLIIRDPAGETVSEISTSTAQNVSVIEHLSQNIALVLLTTCDGPEQMDACPVITDFDDADIYIPPGLVRILHVDTDNAIVTELEIGSSISFSALALDDGWFAVSADGLGTTSLLRIDADGQFAVLEELGSETTRPQFDYVQPVGPQLLAVGSQFALFTDDGVEFFPGTPITMAQDEAAAAFTR